MTNQNPAQSYEIGIFNQLVKNSEEIALTKFKVEEVEKKLISIETKVNDIDNRLTKIEQIGEKILNGGRYVIVAIALSILVNVLSTPLISNLFH